MAEFERQAERATHSTCLDLLRGARAIAGFMYGDEDKTRQIYHLAETSRFPCFKLGGVLCARRSTIVQWIETQEQRSMRASS